MELFVVRERLQSDTAGVTYKATYRLENATSHEQRLIKKYGCGPLRDWVRTWLSDPAPDAKPLPSETIEEHVRVLIDYESKGLSLERDSVTVLITAEEDLVKAFQTLPGYWSSAHAFDRRDAYIGLSSETAPRDLTL